MQTTSMRLFCIVTAFCGTVLLYSAFSVHADGDSVGVLPSAITLSSEKGAVGKLRTLGEYPQERGVGHTVTSFQDGKIFVYGHNANPQSIDSVNLDPRVRTAQKNPIAPVIWEPKSRTWKMLEHPPECQFLAYLHTTTALADGKILIAGGLCDIPRNRETPREHHSHKDMSLWNDITQKWEVAPSLHDARIYHSATLLTDNSVLLVGGESDTRVSKEVEPVLNSVELYRDGKVLQLPRLQVARAKHTATRLANGSVMVIGGMGRDGKALGSVEIWDPVAQTWHVGQTLKVARYQHNASLLPDGRVLVSGGINKDGADSRSVEIWDPERNGWSDAAPLLFPLRRHSSAVLNNGDVLVMGVGFDTASPSLRTMLWEKSTEQWLPAGRLMPDRFTGVMSYALVPMPGKNREVLVFDYRRVMQWTPSSVGATEYPPYGERDGYSSTLLNDGRILLTGGRTQLPVQRIGELSLDWAEIFNPSTGRFSVTGRMHQPMYSPSSIVLADGRVLVADTSNKSALGDYEYTATPNPETGNWRLRKEFPIGYSHHKFAEVWDPKNGQWNLLKELQFPTNSDINIGKLSDGRVLFFVTSFLPNDTKHRVMVWNPFTRSIDTKKVGATARVGAAIEIIPDGRVLLTGGRTHNIKLDEVWNTQVWDSRTDATVTLPFPPNWRGNSSKSLLLRSGDVLLVNFFRVDPKTPAAPVVVWNARSGRMLQLPALPIDKDWDTTRQLSELSDGTIITDKFWLEPGADSWLPVQRFPQNQAGVTQLASGKLLALSTSSPHAAYLDVITKRWKLQANYYLRHKSAVKPVLLELSDGRVMVSGAIDIEGRPNETTVQIWSPKDDAWTTTGKLQGIYDVGEAALLPSGQVLHLGVDQGGNLNCEIGHPVDDNWSYCGSPAPEIKSRREFMVSALNDGRVALMFGQSDAYVYHEQTKHWTPTKGDLTQLMKSGPGTGKNSFLLPDGCSLSGPPFRLFNPKTKKEETLSTPVIGIKNNHSRMIILSNGTVVVAGYPDGPNGVGDGFFHRKASCSGFETLNSDGVYMPGVLDTPPSQLSPDAPDTESIPVSIPINFGFDRLIWIALAIFFPFILYLMLRRIVRRVDAVDPGLVLPKQVAWVTRTIVYAFATVIVLSVLWNFIGRGSLKDKLKFVTSTAPPCRFVGHWSSTRSGSTYRITLRDDGRFVTDPIANGVGQAIVHTGTWEVQGDKMLWRHDGINDSPPDINPIRQESGNQFSLIEVNGEHSKFELIEKIKTTNCSP